MISNSPYAYFYSIAPPFMAGVKVTLKYRASAPFLANNVAKANFVISILSPT